MSVWISGALRSRTVWLNGLVLLSSLLAVDEVSTVITPEHLLSLQAAINLILRVVTSQSLAEKGKGTP